MNETADFRITVREVGVHSRFGYFGRLIDIMLMFAEKTGMGMVILDTFPLSSRL